ncbi:MAG: hypothetical protein MJK08_07455 [Campylobacterales bacterium]|nr:hypothetical protein [Campylobacterales bacterium]
MIKIHDIKDITTIPDYSLYILIFICLFVLFILIVLIFLFYKYYKNRSKVNKRKDYFRILENLDLTNTKESAYLISKYSFILCKSIREKKLMEEINEILEDYKYKKDVKKFPKEFIAKYELFLESIDV